MIGQLPYLHVGVDADRLNCDDFQGPEPFESHITIPGSNVDEQPQAANGGTAL